MKTDAEWKAWLADDGALPVVLAEVTVRVSGAGADTVRYLSTDNFVSAPTDTPANQKYEALLSKDLTVNESLAIDSLVAAMSIGDIGITNRDGEQDDWLFDIWANRSIVLRCGDLRWTRDDMRIVFDGTNADIGAKSRQELGLKLRDKLLRLNASATEAKVAATGVSQDVLIPQPFGEVMNMTPVAIGPNEWQVSATPMEGITEVRDNGVPVVFTQTVSTGKFTLNQAPEGAITCDVQGDKPAGVYINTVAKIIERLVTGFGKASDRFTTADLDTAQLATFNTAHPQPVGFVITDRTNVLNVCRDLAGSVGAQVSMSRAGKLRLLKIQAPGTSKMTITATHMVEGSLTPTTRTDVVAAVKLGFSRNWTEQPGLTTGLSATDKEDLARKWSEAYDEDLTVASIYKLSTEPVQQDTMLLKRTHAEAEATRLLNLRKVPRTVYQFTGYASLFDLELGDTVTLQHSRFGLAAGVPGIVVSLNLSWARRRVTVGVLI